MLFIHLKVHICAFLFHLLYKNYEGQDICRCHVWPQWKMVFKCFNFKIKSSFATSCLTTQKRVRFYLLKINY